MLTEKRRLIFCIVMAIIAAFLLVALPMSMAWYAINPSIKEEGLAASSLVNYYHSGDGSFSNPYVITEARHLYNLIWLQNHGEYNKPNQDTQYFVVGDVDHPVSEIDMAGMLADADGNTGAVPPIGSKSYPFRGSFNGNGVIIKNLWVSTDIGDWAERPGDLNVGDFDTDFTDGVGFFGIIERPAGDTERVVYAGNFILENIEITTSLPTSKVGIVAGYMDGAMSRVGVNNAMLTAKNTTSAKTLNSEYVLIGETPSGTVWQDIPGTQGSGDLVIAPTGLTENKANGITYNAFTSVTSGTREVTGAVEGSAYYVAGLNLAPFKPNTSYFYKFNGDSSFNSSQLRTVSITSGTSTPLTASTPDTVADEEYLDYCFQTAPGAHSYYRNASAFVGISPSGKPVFTGISQGTYPTNCIWFKPQNDGSCYVSFACTNKGSALYMSVYRFKRTASGTLLSGSLQELRLEFPKGSFSNGTAVLFEVPISPADIEAGYEYAVGASGAGTSTTYTASTFFFLKLAGTDVNSSQEASAGKTRVLEQVEFICQGTTDINVAFPAEGHEAIQSHLALESFTVAASTSSTIHFVRLSSGVVNYSDARVVEKVGVDPASVPNSTLAIYPPRVTRKETMT